MTGEHLRPFTQPINCHDSRRTDSKIPHRPLCSSRVVLSQAREPGISLDFVSRPLEKRLDQGIFEWNKLRVKFV